MQFERNSLLESAEGDANKEETDKGIGLCWTEKKRGRIIVMES